MVYSELLSAYSEPHRHYHTVQHIDDCLAQFDEAAFLTHAPEEVELALWFHDAIYKPTSWANERKSADWATSFLESVGVGQDRRDRVRQHIMATQHLAESPSDDAAVVVDIDLSILGRDADTYDRYEQAIREEYRWVPGPIYRRKRIEVLEPFLGRQAIYGSEYFRSRYEQAARQNLKRAVERLRK
jgi:predicted metal-dependent HD superfamily phosphohydrolase